MDFGRILDRIYEAFCAFFGRILGEAFQVEELALMIRATRGRSMDGWMDGWSRPNHMPSHLDALQTMIPVDLRRLAGGLHGVAKQASLSVAFRSDFEGF